MKIPRWMHHFWATALGYYWKPCPICGDMYGGHEGTVALMSSYSTGHMVCPDCSDEAIRRNQRWIAAHPINQTMGDPPMVVVASEFIKKEDVS